MLIFFSAVPIYNTIYIINLLTWYIPARNIYLSKLKTISHILIQLLLAQIRFSMYSAHDF